MMAQDRKRENSFSRFFLQKDGLNLNQVPCKKNLWPDYIQVLLSRKLQENQRENMFHNYVREGI